MKVTLKFPHTHAGTLYAAGATIDVPVVDALWMKAQDLIEEAVGDIKAELKKLASKDNPEPHADALAKAESAEAAAKAAAAPDASATASAAPATGTPAAASSSVPPIK